MENFNAFSGSDDDDDDDDGSLMGRNEKALFLFVFQFMTFTTPKTASPNGLENILRTTNKVICTFSKLEKTFPS